MLTRRAVFGMLGGVMVAPAALAHARQPARLYLNAYGGGRGFGVAGFDATGQIRYSLALPGRGHSFACSRDLAVAFSRRPGDTAVVFAARDGRALYRIDAAEDRSFCGHGAFTPDGRLLFATEAVGSTGEGMLGLYDTHDAFRRIAEFPTHGLDPHEVRLMPDGRTLVVANGGILMRADMPRLKLNIPEMDPSLVYLDSRDGRVLNQVRPAAELRQLSIRHITIDRRGRVAIAMQYEGPAQDAVPLVAMHGGAQDAAGLRYLPLPEAERAALQQYCGSAAVDAGGRFLAVTSPRGNRALVWNLDDDRLVGAASLTDVCGVAAGPEAGFVLSNGLGRLYDMDSGLKLQAMADSQPRRQWDNHMLALDL